MSIVFVLERTNQLNLLPDKDLVDLCPHIESYQVTKNLKHTQKGILHCYNDKRFVLEKSLKLFPTAIFVDADTRLIESLSDNLDFTPGIVGYHQSMVEHNKKYRPRDLPNLIRVSEKLGIPSEQVNWIGESLFIVTRDGGKEQEFLHFWGRIALYLEMKGMHSGEGSIMGLAAAKVGWTVDISEAWLILKNKSNHLDASYQPPIKKDFWQPLQKRLRQFKNETHQPQELTKKGSSGTV